MEPKVLYEASFVFQWAWFVLLIIPAFFFYAVIYNINIVREKKTVGNIISLILSIVSIPVILFVLITVVPDQIRMYDSTVKAYRRGDYQIVEGYVENFHPMPKEGHDTERFTIDDIPFEYGTTVSFGYQKTKIKGGVITGDGQHLRIGYTHYGWLGIVIVYIEELP